jgi:hypothetical protein
MRVTMHGRADQQYMSKSYAAAALASIAGKMRGFAPIRPDHVRDCPLPRALPYLLACLLGLFAVAGFWYGLGQPVILPDAATPTHKLQCASYTPFDKDQSPFDQPFVPRALSAWTLTWPLLATRFQCVRTYSQAGP